MARRRFKEWEVIATLINQGVLITCFRSRVPITLENVARLQREHLHELALGGPDEPANCRYSLENEHRVVTFGTKSTSAGSSAHRIAKTKRFEKLNKGLPKRVRRSRPLSPRQFPKAPNPQAIVSRPCGAARIEGHGCNWLRQRVWKSPKEDRRRADRTRVPAKQPARWCSARAATLVLLHRSASTEAIVCVFHDSLACVHLSSTVRASDSLDTRSTEYRRVVGEIRSLPTNCPTFLESSGQKRTRSCQNANARVPETPGKLVGESGFEPPAPASRKQCSHAVSRPLLGLAEGHWSDGTFGGSAAAATRELLDELALAEGC